MSDLRPELKRALRGLDWNARLDEARARRIGALRGRRPCAGLAPPDMDGPAGPAPELVDESDAEALHRHGVRPGPHRTAVFSPEVVRVPDLPDEDAMEACPQGPDVCYTGRVEVESSNLSVVEELPKAAPAGVRERGSIPASAPAPILVTSRSNRPRRIVFAGLVAAVGGVLAVVVPVPVADVDPAEVVEAPVQPISAPAPSEPEAAGVAASLPVSPSLDQWPSPLVAPILLVSAVAPEPDASPDVPAFLPRVARVGTEVLFDAMPAMDKPPAPPAPPAAVSGPPFAMLAISGAEAPPKAVGPIVAMAPSPAVGRAGPDGTQVAWPSTLMAVSADARPVADLAPAPLPPVAVGEGPRDAERLPEIVPLDEMSYVTVFLRVPETVPQERLSEISAMLSAAGLELRPAARVDYVVSWSQVRYFHPEDAAVAERIGQALAAEPRDFADYRPSPPRGVIEVFIEGEVLTGGPEEARGVEVPVTRLRRRTSESGARRTDQIEPASTM